MAPGITFASLVLLSTSLVGCEAEYRDVSEVPPHKELIGQVCSMTITFTAFGVTRKVERDRKTDYVLVSELRLSGPEFTFAEPIPADAKLRILSARRCSNCPFEEYIQYNAALQPSSPRLTGLPVYVRQSSVSSNALHCG